jgi:predicted O-linked N-acetylglucosamine transferase (SPINDLY family)
MMQANHIDANANAGRPGHLHWTEGMAYVERQDWDAAIDAFSRATVEAPADVLYWINLANAHRRAGDLAQALAAVEKAVRVQPHDPLALRMKGDTLAQMHRYAESVATFQQLENTGALEYDAILMHGTQLQAVCMHHKAIEKLMEAAALKPQEPAAHALMATSFRDMAMFGEAIECLKTVLALDPNNLQARSHLSYERRHLCDWEGHDEHVQRLREILLAMPAGQAHVATTFAMLALPIEPELLLVAARGEALSSTLGVTAMPPVDPAQRIAAGKRGEPLVRVGMLSYDFHEHPVSQLLVEVLEGLDRQGFELSLYASGVDDCSELRQRICQAADSFVDIRGFSDQQAAKRIRDDGIDILVDLQGFTRGQRLPIFAYKPAPVQVTFLGFAGTTGASFIDYIVGDPYVTPIEHAANFSEKLAQMPLVFQPNGRWRPIPGQAAALKTRAEVGLPKDAFVMCAFNNTYKILPETFNVWCEVMLAVPHAVLWLKGADKKLFDNVHRLAEARGVAAERFIFAQTVPYAEHFSRMALADVFVDTWPYNAHTTASDALWAGVPVVTVRGNSFASRVAASLLNAVGMPELAFETAAGYRDAIIKLAQNPALLAGYHQRLRTQRMELPLFDSTRFTRDFEQLLQRMAQRWRSGLPAEHLLATP